MTEATLTPELVEFVKQSKDRQEIRDCLLRYTRGVDRHDLELMKSAYHPDAWDEHGVAEGDPESFCNWAIGWHAEFQHRHQHVINNQTIELDGDMAHSETYYLFFGENREGPPTLAFGRYVDRLEKRQGRWAIAHRVCVNEYAGSFNSMDYPAEYQAMMKATGPDTRDKNDVSYVRPLTKDRARLG
ncbi:nuclear transport factor 2 family protein [Novosphingobium taihuense]|uniref:Ketosteroid isomerase-like protein n=1 Tax=Novosphingobium taihuense TaxID=260085 RepID=A0A7W7ADL0_9SPHN|nr:nuclear transport factor 2 family protein [Novosphingobium taihuense]MBB4615022.1 ketosteroid isomerase-like protein [Novosphingobium taihuense]TWH84537.1 SnoaL-like protein [Novosphingobium taihuense]